MAELTKELLEKEAKGAPSEELEDAYDELQNLYYDLTELDKIEHNRHISELRFLKLQVAEKKK
jgi:hypothetical protein